MDDAGTQAERRDQLRLLTDSVTAFAAKRLPVSRSRRLRGVQPEFEPAMMAELAEQGWLGLQVPESVGGFGLGFAEARAVVEAVSGQLAPEPLVPVATLAAGVLCRCAAAERRDALVADLIAGTAVPGLAWQDTDGSLDPARPAFSAQPREGGWRVEGEARFVRPGSGATHYLLAAPGEEGIALYIVEPDRAGLEITAEAQADGTALARVRARSVDVDASARLLLPAAEFAAALDEAVLMNAAELLALVRRMRLMTLDYLKTRAQFGKPIGSFQALQHRAVDLLIQEELTCAALDHAVDGFDGGADGARRASLASRAKARAAEAAIWTAREAIQMHGGIGVTDEYDLGLYVNRALALAPWLGSAGTHRRRFIDLNPPAVEKLA